jgi:hypothetical protein
MPNYLICYWGVDQNGSRADLVDIGVELLLLDNDNAGLPLVGVLDRNLVQLGHFLLHGYKTTLNNSFEGCRYGTFWTLL